MLHREHNLDNFRCLITPPTKDFPPVKVLHISTNSALSALQVATKLSFTLEELNWTVPDASRQRRHWPFLRDTATLLENLRRSAKKLRVLRICMEAPICEGNDEYGRVMGAFSLHLRHITSLEVLELHICSKSPYFGQEVIDALPCSLTRFYTSDKLISAETLAASISRRYLNGVYLASDETVRPANGMHVGIRTPRMLKLGTKDEFECQIGEEKNRLDYIPLGTGKLGFIGFEHAGSSEAAMTLLRLNARLLDRQRNLHLVAYDGGYQISPRVINLSANQDNYGGPIMVPNRQSRNGDDVASGAAGVNTSHEEETKEGEMVDMEWYFGKELKAQVWFEQEPVTTVDDVVDRTWPEDVMVQESEHWMSEE